MATEVLDMMRSAVIRPALYGVGSRFDGSDRERAAALSSSRRAPDRAPSALARVPEIDPHTDGIVGGSAALQAVLARARKVAPTDSTVLVTGETGTGKELLAHAIHMASQRAGGPFVSVNCAAIPQTLIASELFGHERGAFTGALQRRRGRFELAAGGTLFLDEVGELPVETQVLLLRVLQEREFERVGGTTTVSADVRVVAATNRDLRQAIAEGSFRSDLFYRLAVFPLEMPPLREREGDIRLLAEHFVRRSARRVGKSIRAIDPGDLAPLEAYSWPGNVRELQNVIECSVILCESDTFAVDPGWLHSEPPLAEPKHARLHAGETKSPEPKAVPRPGALRSTLDDIQREAILSAVQSCGWIIGGPNGAAALLGLKRTTLQARMHKLGIAPLRPAAWSEGRIEGGLR
jgi:transcriptional regulator with GAF, ATPase, and Fis domain